MSPPGDRQLPPPTYRPLGAAGRVDGPREKERGHDRVNPDRLSGSLELVLTTLDPLHVGSGGSNFFQMGPRTELARDLVVQNVDGLEVPVLPGSSIKGAVRSIAEAVGGGCDLGDRCQPACVVCAIFGYLRPQGGYLGRVGFDDALPVDRAAAADRIIAMKLPMPFQPRAQKGRRVYGVAPKSAESPVLYVVVDRGVSFATRLHMHNLTEAELGLVLVSAGAGGAFRLRLGGGKFANLGRVAIRIASATLRRSYAVPAPEQLDGAAAGELARKAMAAANITPKGHEVLRVLEGTLGDR